MGIFSLFITPKFANSQMCVIMAMLSDSVNLTISGNRQCVLSKGGMHCTSLLSSFVSRPTPRGLIKELDK